MNSGGTTKSRVTVPSSIPPTVPTPTDMFPLAPTPLANISGSIPNTMVSEVMSMGRRRALAAACRCVLGKQYGGLGEQSDEHDEPRLHVYVVFKSPQLCEDEAAHQSEGHAQDDGKRYHEALVEGAQDEVYEDYADDEHHGGGIACRGFLTRHASELVAVAFGQCLVGCLTHGVNCLPRTVAIGWRTIDSYG